jgi:hypothetical protein
MRQSNTRTVAEQKPLGVIDSVSAGLSLVWRRPWTLLVPILLDSLIWMLPRLSLAQLFRPYTDQILAVTAFSADAQSAEEARVALQQMIASFNVLGLVVTGLNAVTRVPSLLAMDAAQVSSPITAWAYSIPLQSSTLLVLFFIPLFALGLLAVALYLEWIAEGARPLESASPTRFMVRVALLWLRLIFFALLLLALVFAATLVLLVLQTVFNSPELAAFVTLLISVGLFWLVIYFFFVPSAAALGDIGIREALKRSTLMFRAFFWSTLGLVALSVFLDRGLAIVWDGLTVSMVGVGIAIVGNAFIGTSLIAASMVYYQDRMNLLERIRAHTKPSKK